MYKIASVMNAWSQCPLWQQVQVKTTIIIVKVILTSNHLCVPIWVSKLYDEKPSRKLFSKMKCLQLGNYKNII